MSPNNTELGDLTEKILINQVLLNAATASLLSPIFSVNAESIEALSVKKSSNKLTTEYYLIFLCKTNLILLAP